MVTCSDMRPQSLSRDTRFEEYLQAQASICGASGIVADPHGSIKSVPSATAPPSHPAASPQEAKNQRPPPLPEWDGKQPKEEFRAAQLAWFRARFAESKARVKGSKQH